MVLLPEGRAAQSIWQSCPEIQSAHPLRPVWLQRGGKSLQQGAGSAGSAQTRAADHHASLSSLALVRLATPVSGFSPEGPRDERAVTTGFREPRLARPREIGLPSRPHPSAGTAVSDPQKAGRCLDTPLPSTLLPKLRGRVGTRSRRSAGPGGGGMAWRDQRHAKAASRRAP